MIRPRLRLTTFMLLGLSAGLAGKVPAQTFERFEYAQVEMAVPVRLVLYAPDEPAADRAAKAAMARIRQLNGIMSDYDPASELRRLCATAGQGKAVPVSEDLWRVLLRSRQVSQQSEGAFDVTVGPVVRLWRRARSRRVLPSAERLEPARQLVDYRLIRLDAEHRAVELTKAGMRLDLGGIAKGYAIDEALAVLRKHGINRALVDAGGDVVVGDAPPERDGWRIGIAPLEALGPPSRILVVTNAAVATSGDAWQYVEIDGRRYSHLVDPRTGLGLTDHSSVSIFAPDGITADALASAVSVLGPQKGLKLIHETPRCEAFIVRAPDKEVETYQSEGWADLPSTPTADEKPQ